MSEECEACLELRKMGPSVLSYLTPKDDALCGFHASELQKENERLRALLPFFKDDSGIEYELTFTDATEGPDYKWFLCHRSKSSTSAGTGGGAHAQAGKSNEVGLIPAPSPKAEAEDPPTCVVCDDVEDSMHHKPYSKWIQNIRHDFVPKRDAGGV